MAKNELVKDIDDLTFETDVDSTEMDDLEDISEEELAEIEELVEKPKKKKLKKKKPKKKPKKDKPKKKPKKQALNNSIFYIILVLVIIALILAVGFSTNWFTSTKTEQVDGVVAYVNGKSILLEDLNTRYEKASKASLFPLTKEEVLNTLIEQKLIEQESEKNNIIVTPEEVEASLNELLAVRGLTKEQIEENLAMSGATIDDLLLDLRYYMLLDKLGNVTFAKDITVSNSDLVNYLSERVLVRHILLLSEEENDELYSTLVDLKEELDKDSTEFCLYATEISQDTASIANCGRYFFKAGDMVPEFEEAAFSMVADEISVIKTAYGYHLIQKLSFDQETRDKAEENIKADKASDAYIIYLSLIKDEADIEIISSDETEVVEEESPFEIILDDEIIDEEEVVDEEEPIVIEEEIVEEEEEVIEIIIPEEESLVEEEEIIVTEEEVVEEITYKPIIKFFYSETDENKADITQLIRDLQLQDYIDVEWRCIRVNIDDKEICIDLYGEYAYEMAMTEASDLGLAYAPTVFINNIEYVEAYTVDSIREAICNLAGC